MQPRKAARAAHSTCVHRRVWLGGLLYRKEKTGRWTAKGAGGRSGCGLAQKAHRNAEDVHHGVAWRLLHVALLRVPLLVILPWLAGWRWRLTRVVPRGRGPAGLAIPRRRRAAGVPALRRRAALELRWGAAGNVRVVHGRLRVGVASGRRHALHGRLVRGLRLLHGLAVRHLVQLAICTSGSKCVTWQDMPCRWQSTRPVRENRQGLGTHASRPRCSEARRQSVASSARAVCEAWVWLVHSDARPVHGSCGCERLRATSAPREGASVLRKHHTRAARARGRADAATWAVRREQRHVPRACGVGHGAQRQHARRAFLRHEST